MKKKILLLILISIFLTPLFSEVTHKILTVGFHGNLTSVEIGVSKTRITSIADKPTSLSTSTELEGTSFSDLIQFKKDFSGNTGDRVTDPFFIYYKIYTKDPVSVTIKATTIGENGFTFDNKLGNQVFLMKIK